jgi:hypothetical protein
VSMCRSGLPSISKKPMFDTSLSKQIFMKFHEV